MVRKLFVLLVFSISSALFAGDWVGPPSEGAEGMAGALGTFHFRPEVWLGVPGVDDHPDGAPVTVWKDTDGVDPGTAGCHVEVVEGEKEGRMFPEACLSKKLLVESNPGIKDQHDHRNDVGHPDKFDCDLWCKGQGAEGGMCVTADAPYCGPSAKCACSGEPAESP